MFMTKVGLPSFNTPQKISLSATDSDTTFFYDFGLPPALQLVPQSIEFIDPDIDTSDSGANDQFIKCHPPETPQVKKANNPFSATAAPFPKLKTLRLPKASSQQSLDDYPSLEKIKKEIEPLLRDHKKRGPYPKKVIQLARQAARENPDLKTKKLAEILGIPNAILYYWLGYRSPKRPGKKAINPTV